MMDISDGLATDLAHICAASGVGAEIFKELLPVSEHLQSAAGIMGKPVLDFVLKGGEDYQLLFTIAPDEEEKLRTLVEEKNEPGIYRIGRIIKGQGVFLADALSRKEITYQGYDHFVP